MTPAEDAAYRAGLEEGYREGVTDTVNQAEKGAGPAARAALRYAADLAGSHAVMRGAAGWLDEVADQAVRP